MADITFDDLPERPYGVVCFNRKGDFQRTITVQARDYLEACEKAFRKRARHFQIIDNQEAVEQGEEAMRVAARNLLVGRGIGDKGALSS